MQYFTSQMFPKEIFLMKTIICLISFCLLLKLNYDRFASFIFKFYLSPTHHKKHALV